MHCLIYAAAVAGFPDAAASLYCVYVLRLLLLCASCGFTPCERVQLPLVSIYSVCSKAA